MEFAGKRKCVIEVQAWARPLVALCVLEWTRAEGLGLVILISGHPSDRGNQLRWQRLKGDAVAVVSPGDEFGPALWAMCRQGDWHITRMGWLVVSATTMSSVPEVVGKCQDRKSCDQALVPLATHALELLDGDVICYGDERLGGLMARLKPLDDAVQVHWTPDVG